MFHPPQAVAACKGEGRRLPGTGMGVHVVLVHTAPRGLMAHLQEVMHSCGGVLRASMMHSEANAALCNYL